MPFATDLIGFFNALYTLVHKKQPHPDDFSSVMRLFYYQQNVHKAFCCIRLAALFIHDNRMLAERAFYY